MKTINESLDEFFDLFRPFGLDPRYPIKYDFEKLKKKEKRSLEFITKGIPYHPKAVLESHPQFPNSDKISQAHQLYDLAKLSDRERRNHWINNRLNQQKKWEEYKTSPKRERKDNKDIKNTSTGKGGASSIRFPSKKRSRSTWKRFYKLFPHLKPKDNG